MSLNRHPTQTKKPSPTFSSTPTRAILPTAITAPNGIDGVPGTAREPPGTGEPTVLSASPSDKYLALVQYGEKPPSLYVARLNGFEVQKISDEAGLFTSWSKASDRLAFCEWEKARIMVWSPSEDTPKDFPAKKGKPSHPTWIGSSDSLAFVVDERELWKLDVASGEQEVLITASDVLKAQAPSEE